MSRMQIIGVEAAALALGGAGVACSGDGGSEAFSGRATIERAEARPGLTDLGHCPTYSIDQVKGVLGGEDSFKQLPPTDIGSEGDEITGESCGWARFAANGDSVILRVEARDYGEGAGELEPQCTDLETGTRAAEPVDLDALVLFATAGLDSLDA